MQGEAGVAGGLAAGVDIVHTWRRGQHEQHTGAIGDGVVAGRAAGEHRAGGQQIEHRDARRSSAGWWRGDEHRGQAVAARQAAGAGAVAEAARVGLVGEAHHAVGRDGERARRHVQAAVDVGQHVVVGVEAAPAGPADVDGVAAGVRRRGGARARQHHCAQRFALHQPFDTEAAAGQTEGLAVDLAQRVGGHRQRPALDAGRGGQRVGAQAVVAGIGTGQGEPADVDGQPVAGVGAGKQGAAGAEAEAVAGQGVAADRDQRIGVAVVNLVGRRRAGHQGTRRDVHGQAAGSASPGAGDRVVAEVGAFEAQPRDGDGLGGAGVLVGHRAADAAAAQPQVVASQHTAQAAARRVDGHERGAVVDPFLRRNAQQQHRPRCNVHGEARRADDGVVGCIGTAEAEPGHRHRLRGPRGLVDHGAGADVAAGQVDADVVTGNDVDGGGAGDQGAGDLHITCAVVDAVHGLQARQAADVQRPLRDAGHRADGVGQQAVVGGIAAGERDAAHQHGLAVPDAARAAAGERGGLVDADAVTGDAAVQHARHRGRGAAVIDACATGVVGHQGLGGDVGAGGAAGVQQAVVQGIGAARRADQAATADADGLAGAHVLGVGAGEEAAAGDADEVAAHEVGRTAGDAHRGGAVVDAAQAGVHGRQRLGRDVHGDARGRSHQVVTGVGAAERDAAHRHRLVAADVLVGHDAGRGAGGGGDDADVVAGDEVGRVGADRAAARGGDGHGGGAVVDAVVGHDAGETFDAQRSRRDGGHGTGAADVHAVVRRVGAGQADGADAHRLVDACVLRTGAGEDGGLHQADVVTHDEAVCRSRDGRRHRAVVDAAAAQVAHRQAARRDDAGGRAGGVEQAVVRHVGPAEADCGDGYRLARAGVLGSGAAEDAAAGDAEHVAGNEVGGGADDAGRSAAVVFTGGGGVDRRQRPRGDVDGDAAGGSDAVVGGVCAGQVEPGHGHGFGAADILVEHRARGGAGGRRIHRDHIARDQVLRVGRDGAAGADHDADDVGAVVDTVGGGHARQAVDAQGTRRDVARGVGEGGGERVIGRVIARQRDAVDGNGLVRADVLVAGEHRRLPELHRVAVDESAGAGRHQGMGGAVVDLVQPGVVGYHRLGRDVRGGVAGGVDERVVGRVAATQAAAEQADGLAAADVARTDAGEDAGGANDNGVACQQIGGRTRGRGIGAAVVDAVDAVIDRRDGLARDVDGDAGRGSHQVVGGVGAAERQAIDDHGLVVAGVLGGHGAAGDATGRQVDGDGVAAHDVGAARRNAAAGTDHHLHRPRAVVDAVRRAGTGDAVDADRLRRDAAGGAGTGAGELVVGRIGAVERDAADTDRLVAGDILGASAGERRRLRKAQHVARQHAGVARGHRCVHAAVVDARAAVVHRREVARRDAGGRQAGGIQQAVVVALGPGEETAAHRHRLVDAGVLAAAELPAGADAQGADVDGQDVGAAAADGGQRGAVVDAVGRGVAGRQRTRRDVHGEAAAAHTVVRRRSA